MFDRDGDSSARGLSRLSLGCAALAIAGAICAGAGAGQAYADACPTRASPAAARQPSRLIAAEFERRYNDWRRESRVIAFSSNTHDYVALPGFGRLVDLGPAALPLIEQKLSRDRGGDFMLAEAVVKICGWDRGAFTAESEQAFRDQVLRRLHSAPTATPVAAP